MELELKSLMDRKRLVVEQQTQEPSLMCLRDKKRVEIDILVKLISHFSANLKLSVQSNYIRVITV